MYLDSKVQKDSESLQKAAYWATGGILASLAGRGVGCMAATYVGILDPKRSSISSEYADGTIFVGLAKLR